MGTIGKVCNSKECSVSVKPKMALLKGKEPRSKGTDTSPGERERLEKTSCLEKQPECRRERMQQDTAFKDAPGLLRF